jgi:hypothetical protein
MKKTAKQYQGFHTHPSQDSSAKILENGTVLVTHRVDRREGFIITQLAKGGLSTENLRDKLNQVFPNGGYNVNHVKHACDRLRADSVVVLNGHTWSLTANGKSKWEKIKKNVRTFKAG